MELIGVHLIFISVHLGLTKRKRDLWWIRGLASRRPCGRQEDIDDDVKASRRVSRHGVRWVLMMRWRTIHPRTIHLPGSRIISWTFLYLLPLDTIFISEVMEVLMISYFHRFFRHGLTKQKVVDIFILGNLARTCSIFREAKFLSRSAFCDGCGWAVSATQPQPSHHCSDLLPTTFPFLPFLTPVKAWQGFYQPKQTT